LADRRLISDHQHLETAIENGGPRERFIQVQETHSFNIETRSYWLSRDREGTYA
jgi:hypothetical protein